MNPETSPSSSELSGEPMPAPIVVKQEPIPTPETGPVSSTENIQVEAARQEREEARVAREQIEKQFVEEKIKVATDQQQPMSRGENHNAPEVKKDRFNPNYESTDPYERLGVPRNALPKDIEDAWRQASIGAHPDRHPGEVDKWNQRIRDINSAHDYLNASPGERRKMDNVAEKIKRAEDRFNPKYSEKPTSSQPKTEQPQTEQPTTKQRVNPEAPKTESNEQEAQPSQNQTFNQGAEKTAENKATGEEERKAAQVPDQKSFARKAGELTGRVGRVAKRGAKAFGDTYRQAEEERKASQLGQKSFARRAGEFTGRAGRVAAEAWKKATAEARKTAEERVAGEEEPVLTEAVPESEVQSVPQQIAGDQIELNSAQKLIEKLRLEIEQLKKENEFSQLEGLGKELNDLLSKREELNEKVSGKSIGETMADAEKKVATMFGYEKREDYVRAHTEAARININNEREKDLTDKAFAELPEKERQKKYGNSPELYKAEMEKKREKMGLKSEEFYGLMAVGYKPQETKNKKFFHPIPSFRNFFRSERKVTIPPNGQKVWMRTDSFKALAKEAGEKYTTNNTNEAQKRLGEQWGNAVGMQVEESMKERANDKDGAIEKIQDKCKEERMKLLAKFLKDWEELSGNSKKLNSRESKAYEANGVEGKDISSLFKDAQNTEGNLNGNHENDSKVVSGLLKGYGVVVRSSKIAGKMLKGTGGLLKLLISLITTATLGAVHGAGKGIEYFGDRALKIPKKKSSN